MAKKNEGVLGKFVDALTGGPAEKLTIALGEGGADPGTAVNLLLAGEEQDVVARIGTASFPADGLALEALAERVLAFLDLAARTEAGGQNRSAVLDAITQRGVEVLEPPVPETRPAQPPEGGAAPPPEGEAQQPPRSHPAPATAQRSDLADEDGLVELVVLREDGLAGSGGAFVAVGKKGKFSSDEAYAHLTSGNARLPTPED